MAKRTKRTRGPKTPRAPRGVRTIPFELPDGRLIEAHDLNDVVRHVLRELMAEHGWSETETASRIGWTQTAFNDFMRQGAEDLPSAGTKPKGMTVHTLSKIAAAVGHNSPVLLFQRHPMFAGSAERAAYNALAQVVTETEAADLAEILDVLRGRESVSEFLSRTRSMLGLDSKGPRKPTK